MAETNKTRAASTAKKKPTAKKPVAKKAPAKKPEAKKAPAKKPVAKKPATKKAPAKRAPAKKPVAKKRQLSQAFLDEMRRKLLAERAKYVHSAEEYRAEAESILETSEPGDVQFDEEGGEGATLAIERERDIALSNQARETVAQIDAALKRIEDGTYGDCVTSGAPIPQARLRAIPWAAQRVEVKAGGIGRR